MTDITTEADVRVLMDEFNTAIRSDALLNPIFTDVAQVDWAHRARGGGEESSTVDDVLRTAGSVAVGAGISASLAAKSH